MRPFPLAAAAMLLVVPLLPVAADLAEDLDPPALLSAQLLPDGVFLTWFALQDPPRFKVLHFTVDGRGDPPIFVDGDKRTYFDPITSAGPHIYYMQAQGDGIDSAPSNALMATEYAGCEVVIVDYKPLEISQQPRCAVQG